MKPAPPAILRDAVLRERARKLAQEEPKQASEAQLEVLVFDLGPETYAVETAFVREVHPLDDLTPIPCTPTFVLGVINLRGELSPVIELRRLLGLPERGLTNATRAVVIHNADMEFGIVADAIVDVRLLRTDEILPPPPILSGINARFLRGVTPNRMVILNAATILAYPGLIVNEHVEG
jgi:purine-binding chemotaxis protein CheW